jgi:hypothetical protein
MKTRLFIYRPIVAFFGSFATASLFLFLKAPNLQWSLTYAIWLLPAVAGAIYLLYRGESKVFWISIVALVSLTTSLVLRLQDWTRNCTDCSPIGAGSFLSWDLVTQVRALIEIAAFVCYLIALVWLFENLMRNSSKKSTVLIIGNLILLLEAFFLFSDLIASSYWQTSEVFSGITKAYFLADFKIIYALIHGVAFLIVFALICWPKHWETKLVRSPNSNTLRMD